MNDAQATYALARARVDLALAELLDALGRHESDPANWAHADVLERIERGLVALVQEVAPR